MAKMNPHMVSESPRIVNRFDKTRPTDVIHALLMLTGGSASRTELLTGPNVGKRGWSLVFPRALTSKERRVLKSEGYTYAGTHWILRDGATTFKTGTRWNGNDERAR